MNYDKNNIFAKILRGEIPLKQSEKIYEDEFVLSFYDINPKKKSSCFGNTKRGVY